jgi:hypothetical protein
MHPTHEIRRFEPNRSRTPFESAARLRGTGTPPCPDAPRRTHLRTRRDHNLPLPVPSTLGSGPDLLIYSWVVRDRAAWNHPRRSASRGQQHTSTICWGRLTTSAA